LGSRSLHLFLQNPYEQITRQMVKGTEQSTHNLDQSAPGKP